MIDRTDTQRWWQLYREERAKVYPGKAGWKEVPTPGEIWRFAREATRRFEAGRERH